MQPQSNVKQVLQGGEMKKKDWYSKATFFMLLLMIGGFIWVTTLIYTRLVRVEKDIQAIAQDLINAKVVEIEKDSVVVDTISTRNRFVQDVGWWTDYVTREQTIKIKNRIYYIAKGETHKTIQEPRKKRVRVR